MLVLTRKPNQSILIGDDIEVSVLSVLGEKVRIGIKVPGPVPVLRTEIYPRIQRGEISTPPSEGRGSLVLTRRPNESILIGDDIEVSVLSVLGEKVRIGVQGPSEIPVFRKEIYERINEESSTPSYSFGRGDDIAEPFEAEARREVAAGPRRLASAQD